MPRRSTHASSDGSPLTRRTSARIAAAQAASPVKSPVKSPRRKRQSNEPSKVNSEDTESQQSQVNSEVTNEDVNGVETSSSTKDPESLNDSLEVPPQKKSKVNECSDDGSNSDEPHVAENITESQVMEHSETESKQQPSPPADFEVVEQSTVPPHDSEEVKAAISAQGEDGQLLVGFVQVNKDELPAANSVEIKQIAASLDAEHQSSKSCEAVESTESTEEVQVNSVNSNGHQDAPAEEKPQTNGSVENEIHQKVVFHNEDHVQPVPAPAAGDTVADVAPDSATQ